MSLRTTEDSPSESSSPRGLNREGKQTEFPRKLAVFVRELWPFAILALGTLVLALPMFVYGPYPKAHDIYEHITFDRYFSEQFWAGELYPRWLIDINHGLGSPSLFVFPPFQAYVHALLSPITNLLHLDGLVIEQFLVLLISGISAFFWMGERLNRPAALAMALLYMSMPYHLYLDLYQRAAIGECWALAWIPLLLYFASRMAAGSRTSFVFFALTYAVLILSHLISVLMLSPIPILAAIVFSGNGERIRATWRVIAGMILGSGLAGFYLIPALRHAGNFPPYMLTPPVSTYLINFHDLFAPFAGDPFTRDADLCGTDAILAALLCGFAALIYSSAASRKRVLFWLAMCAPPAFMMWSRSIHVWNISTRLIWSVQYAFRLNVILCVGVMALLAEFVAPIRWKRLPSATLGITVVLLVVGPWIYSYGAVWNTYAQEENPAVELASHAYGRFHDDGWFGAWKVKGLDEAEALEASAGPRARFASGTGTATVRVWRPRHLVVDADSAKGGLVAVNQFYYRAWQVSLAGSSAPIDTQPAMPAGLLAVLVPPGHVEVHFDIPVRPAEEGGRILSVVSLGLGLVLLWRSRREVYCPARQA
jgi:hypothetical protein